MSVRKVYQLLIDGDVVLTGSYASVQSAFRAIANHRAYLSARLPPDVVQSVYGVILIAHKPDLVLPDDGFLSV